MAKLILPLGVSIGLFVVMAMLSIGLVSALPAGTLLPIQFRFDGTPTNAAPAAVALSLLPGALLLITAAFALAIRFNRRVAASTGFYVIIWLVVLLALAAGHGLIIRHALFVLASLTK